MFRLSTVGLLKQWLKRLSTMGKFDIIFHLKGRIKNNTLRTKKPKKSICITQNSERV